MADDGDEMLINLNSPENVNNTPYQKTYLKNPLIPGPDVNCNIESNNPFDLVANSAENWDPFELVLHESLKKVENAQSNNGTSKTDMPNKEYKGSTPTKMIVNNDQNANANPCKIFRSQSVTENYKFFRSPSKSSHRSDSDSPTNSEDSPPLNSSMTSKIKSVKKRVNKCIEKALSTSISQPDLTKQESQSPMRTLNNAISRIIGLRSELANFNKNIMDSDYQYKRIPDRSCARLSKSFCTSDCTKESLKDVLEEAKNISLALQNMSITSSKKTVSSDYELINNLSAEEDLMSVKPPWEENGDCSLSSESDDSSIGLPKVKLFYLKKKERKRSEISAEEIEKYKKRIRASLDGNMSCDEESTTSKAVDELKPDEISNIQLSESLMQEKKCLKEKDQLDVLPVNMPVLPGVNDLRPKKRGNILKKGPLKAIVPLQKMTKSIADKISPLRKNTSTTVKAKQDGSFSSSLIYPVASSTPNGKESSSSKKTALGTPLGSKSRLSRRDNEPETKAKVSSFRRSVSLVSESRTSNTKVPFSSVNPNVKLGKGAANLNRPHSAPSKSNYTFGRSSPKSKEPIHRRMAVNDKENRLQAF